MLVEQSITDYCQQNNLCEYTFPCWKRFQGDHVFVSSGFDAQSSSLSLEEERRPYWKVHRDHVERYELCTRCHFDTQKGSIFCVIFEPRWVRTKATQKYIHVIPFWVSKWHPKKIKLHPTMLKISRNDTQNSGIVCFLDFGCQNDTRGIFLRHVWQPARGAVQENSSFFTLFLSLLPFFFFLSSPTPSTSFVFALFVINRIIADVDARVIRGMVSGLVRVVVFLFL